MTAMLGESDRDIREPCLSSNGTHGARKGSHPTCAGQTAGRRWLCTTLTRAYARRRADTARPRHARDPRFRPARAGRDDRRTGEGARPLLPARYAHLDDLAYYWFHRTAHRVRWFWASHVVHHSSQHYNLSTPLRQTWTGFLSLAFLFRLPLFVIGFPPGLVVFVAGVNLVHQFWIHTKAVGRLPRRVEAV